ncbi:MAG: beta-lactamase family protein [Bacteroidetes bacterium]|nr:beta-lactamase family protein [Bacteroidota bacterium]
MKHLFIVTLLFILTANCSQTEATDKQPYDKPSQPGVKCLIDSSRYKDVRYRLDTLFTKLYTANMINGNVLISKNGEIIYQKCFGWANKEQGRMLCDTSMFQLASVSKVFTATAALMLYEQRKLSLDEKVSDILKGFPYPEITVKHLLSHRSGLPNYTYFCSEYLPGDTAMLSNASVLELMIAHKPNVYFNAGARFNYSNTNYMLLALIIEKRSGMNYKQFMESELFAPLGMKHSMVNNSCRISTPEVTTGYTTSFKPVSNDRFDGVYGDKGIYSTTYDLFLFSEALYQHTLLKAETQELAYTPYSKEKKLSNYGYGWRMKNFTGTDKDVFHNGWWHGYRTSFHRRLRDGLTIVVLSNRLNRSVYATWRIFQAIDGPGVTEGKEPDEE